VTGGETVAPATVTAAALGSPRRIQAGSPGQIGSFLPRRSPAAAGRRLLGLVPYGESVAGAHLERVIVGVFADKRLVLGGRLRLPACWSGLGG
jgi:hypothetical protein